MKITKTQRQVLQHLADGWRLVHRPYEYCILFLPGQTGDPQTVRAPTLRALREAGYIETNADTPLSRKYTLTDAGRAALLADAPPVGG